MPEIRHNIATGEWVIIAKERAKRPEDFKPEANIDIENLPPYKDTCPFCIGNEDKTPPEVFKITDDTARWKVRVVPNKFYALVDTEELNIQPFKYSGLKKSIPGFGDHEVIIESPFHNTTLALLDEKSIFDVLFTYRHRHNVLIKDRRIKLVTIFKNHGPDAGTSLEHPHSQLIATPLVPPNVRSRIEEAMRFYDTEGQCVFCYIIEEELKNNERVIFENESFIAIVPYAAFSPFHIWILPKRHMALFGRITDSELENLANCLKDVLLRLYKGLNNPDYNLVIRTSPFAICDVDYYHWYISIIPRITKTAGFELGSGMFINTSIPEESADFLKNIKI